MITTKEYHTSKIYNNCYNETENLRVGRKSILFLLSYKRKECQIIWNRDINAELNIMNMMKCFFMKENVRQHLHKLINYVKVRTQLILEVHTSFLTQNKNEEIKVSYPQFFYTLVCFSNHCKEQRRFLMYGIKLF